MSGKPTSEQLAAEAHRHHLAGRLAQAEAGYRAALAASGRNADAARLLGALLLQRGDAAGAIPLLEKSVRLKPSPAAWVNLAAAVRASDPARAADCCRRAIALDKTLPAAFFNLGHAYRDLKNLPAAADAYRAYLALEPRDAEGHVILGDTLRLMAQPDAAMAAYETALVYDSTHVNAHINVAGIVQSQGYFHAGLAVLESLERAAPDSAEARKALAVARLQLGDFARGWEGFEARFDATTERVSRRPAPPAYWQGESLAGKSILIWTEQGLGDEILFSSMVPDVLARAGACGIQCSPRMVPLFQRSFPGASVVARDAPETAGRGAAFDFQQSAASLARYLRDDFTGFPRHQGYLKADESLRMRLREKYLARAGGRRIVGLSWRSVNPAFGDAKSAALLNFAPILTQPDALFVNLQYGDCRAEIAAVRDALGIDIVEDAEVDSAASMDDFFAQVAAMDLVITTSNTTAHAAGALNVPVWILLPFAAGSIWYWFLRRADSPWYPSAILMRSTDTAEPWERIPVAQAAAGLAGAAR
ncbi:MAG: tetratricopeptide repeat protein [Rhodospirillaceae bacterium]|nr:tetratricopeptide repeat protein [Rhodospirillaceae bacterium]